jgi:uncharacterized protein
MAGRLAPSGRVLLPELTMIAETAVAATGVLRERLGAVGGPSDYERDLAERARSARSLAAAVVMGATHALVTPIDREDVTRLASRLGEVVDAAHRVCALADAINPALPDAWVARLANLLVDAADSLEGAAATVTDRSRALDFAAEVRRLERRGDRAYIEAMGALLTDAPDSLDAVRQSGMYRALRESLRACGTAAALVERIVLKRY